MDGRPTITIAELRAQAVAKEVERKQNLMRLKWFEENYEKVYKNPTLPKDKVPKKAAILYEELKKMRKARFEEDRNVKSKSKGVEAVKEKASKELSLDVMYPIPEAVRNVLYEGVSHDEEGRYKYLKLRYKSDPHEKFIQKVTSGFEYGWRIRDTGKPPTKEHCRRTSWHWRVNGAWNVDDCLRRPPNPTRHVAFPSL